MEPAVSRLGRHWLAEQLLEETLDVTEGVRGATDREAVEVAIVSDEALNACSLTNKVRAGVE